ncbi:hypothetical protein EDD11_008954 [Mortierella claussenii]|nr:hypothetical protein EDD11_008954 [Mortierella claussenii]
MSDHSESHKKPFVLIIGAGLGGLTLGTLLEQLGHPYHIFERAKEVRPLGSAMALGANILPVFEQLGLLEDLKQMSLPVFSLDIYRSNMKLFGSVTLPSRKATGYDDYVLERSRLYELLRSKISPDNITMGKKVLQTVEKDDKIVIHCSDNTTYKGDILVGADGAYSGVRQSLYKRMDEQGLLPKKDREDLAVANVCMVGVAVPKNPAKYEQIQEERAHFSTTLGDNSKVSPWGGSMGDIIQDTPKELISKVFLEEKMFITWHHGRTVLIGDGAVNAMEDAVVLANCIYALTDYTEGNVSAAFEDYYRQRFERANAAFQSSSI